MQQNCTKYFIFAKRNNVALNNFTNEVRVFMLCVISLEQFLSRAITNRAGF
jgi:hypothetical protein